MANGRFSRGVEVIADASLAFVGNIDLSVEQVVNSPKHDLFQPLPPEFDLAVMDRFACYVPGWEMPKNSSSFLTSNYGFITDFLAEAFHYVFKHTNRYEEVSKRIKLGKAVEGRDEKGIKKTVAAFLKILHPNGSPTDHEFEEYVAYAVECRRRVKEQMNKRKPDDEFAQIGLSYFKASGEEVVVFCPESRNAVATQEPSRRSVFVPPVDKRATATPVVPTPSSLGEAVAKPASAQPSGADGTPTISSLPALAEQHLTIHYGDTGHSYESIIGPYLLGATKVLVEDPYIRLQHQIQNFVRLCEVLIRRPNIRHIKLITSYDSTTALAEMNEKLEELKQSLLEQDIALEIQVNPNLHDREIRLDNGWVIKIRLGLDSYQKPGSWFEVGAHDLTLRKCLETKVDIFRST